MIKWESQINKCMGVKISDLPAATHLSGFETQPFVQCGQTRQTSVSSIFTGLTSQGDGRYFCSTTIAGNQQGVITLGGAGGATIGIGLSTGDSPGFASITTAGLTLTGGNITVGRGSLSANNISVVTNLTASSIEGTTQLSAGTGGITTSGNLSSGRNIAATGSAYIGREHIISGTGSSILGGCKNNLGTSTCATIAGGCCNSGRAGSFIGGGICNVGCGSCVVIGGGECNSVSANFNVVGGGRQNDAAGDMSVIVGGCDNNTNATCATIGGGVQNNINSGANGSTITGGQNNTVGATLGTIAGGKLNNVCANASFIGGGCCNTIKCTHPNSAIVGASYMDSVSSNMLHACTLYLMASALPTSDPGVAGVVYLSGGGAAGHTLMISK